MSMSSDDDTIVHDDIFTPNYDRLLKAANTLWSADELALRYRQYRSSIERNWFYRHNDDALQAVKDACEAGKKAEATATPEQLNDPFHFSFAYKTLRQFTSLALLSITNAQARVEYINTIASYASKYADQLAIDPQYAAQRAVAARNTAYRAFQARKAPSDKWFDGVMKSIFDKDGANFSSLLEYCREELFPSKTLNRLTESEKAELFAEVIKKAGKSTFRRDLLLMAEGAVGWAVIITTLGLLVYDIVDSKADFTSKVVEVLGEGALFGAGWAGAAAAEALALELFTDASALTIMLFGLFGGIIAGLAVGALIEALKNLLLEAFGNQHLLWKKYLAQPYVYMVKLPKVDLDLDHRSV